MWTLESVVQSENMRKVANLPYEVSVALYVTPSRISGLKTYDKVGTNTGVELPDISDVVAGCQAHGTNLVILVHNHPYFNGDCDATPSIDDLSATKFYVEQLAALGIVLLDHIIVSPKNHFSFRFNNLI